MVWKKKKKERKKESKYKYMKKKDWRLVINEKK